MFLSEFCEFVSNPTVPTKGAVTKKLMRLERVVFKKFGHELLILFSIFFVSKLASKFPYFLSPRDISLWRLPLADTMQIWLDSRSARKFLADGSQRPGIEKDIGGRQDNRRRRKGCEAVIGGQLVQRPRAGVAVQL